MRWQPYATGWWLDPDSVTATVRDPKGDAVARCYRGNMEARRIATTPDLLNALHEAGDVIEAQLALGEVTAEGWQETLEQIVAALQKAGEAVP